jgi:hypothetical protein
LAEQFDVHANQITQWKGQLLEGAAGVFREAKAGPAQEAADVKTLHAKIVQLTLENDFLEGAPSYGLCMMGWKAMIDPEHDLPIKQQAEVLDISRSTFYYELRPVTAEDLWLMRHIDELHLNYPFAGSRMLLGLLWQQGLEVGRRHIKTLMRKIGVEPIYRKPNTSKPAPGHRIYPCLLRNLAVVRPNQVWAMDIIYIPKARGFIYLAGVVDWFSAGFLPGSYQSPWRLPTASRRSKKPFTKMKNRQSSTPIMAASSPVKLSRSG